MNLSSKAFLLLQVPLPGLAQLVVVGHKLVIVVHYSQLSKVLQLQHHLLLPRTVRTLYLLVSADRTGRFCSFQLQLLSQVILASILKIILLG